MTPVPLAQLDLTPVQRLLLDRLEDRPIPFTALVDLVRAADRLGDEHTLPVRLDQALWPLLDGGWLGFERGETPVIRWADVIPAVQLLERPGVTGRWAATTEADGLRLVPIEI